MPKKLKLRWIVILTVLVLFLEHSCANFPDPVIPKDSIPIITNSIKDIDENTYKTIVLGTKEWMAENLRVTKYNTGAPIKLINTPSEWAKAYKDTIVAKISGNGRDTTGFYNWPSTVVDNNDLKQEYGALYNYYTINQDKLCPTGWHVASDEDWQDLVNFIGGPDSKGELLQVTDAAIWHLPNKGTNITKFSAYPAGGYDVNGDFKSFGESGIWWSKNAYNIKKEKNATFWILTGALKDPNSTAVKIIGSKVLNGNLDMANGLSVRCVKN